MRCVKNILRALAVGAGFLFLFNGGTALAAEGKDLVLRGDAKCTACHDENASPGVLTIGQRRHGVKADGRTPTCTTCHGESDKHIASPADTLPDVVFHGKGKAGPDTANAVCLNCHESGKRTFWEGSRHQVEGIECVSCHSVHKPTDPVQSKFTQPEVCFNCHKEQRADALKFSHHPVLEGKVVCSDCHNPHGGAGPKNLAKNTVNEVCFQCHAEKRGPYLYEHPPVVDDCMNCHTPHGSNNSPLLKAKLPWLCQDCHAESAPHPGNVYSAASLPGGRAATINRTGPINPITGMPMNANQPPAQLALRACLNCHSQIHGSNAPGGNGFVR